jgi:hypothetical protein
MFYDNYDIQQQDEMDNRAEYAEAEAMAMLDLVETMRMTFCPDCAELITDDNELIQERYNPDDFGCCASCYDPTPA